MTLQDALVAYRTYARAEGKSQRTVDWVICSVGYFTEFLSSKQQDIGTIPGKDLRRFIIALRDRPKFANHPDNKPQQTKLSGNKIFNNRRDKSFYALVLLKIIRGIGNRLKILVYY